MTETQIQEIKIMHVNDLSEKARKDVLDKVEAEPDKYKGFIGYVEVRLVVDMEKQYMRSEKWK